MTKHTSGPWKMEFHNDYPFPYFIYGADGGLIAECCRGDMVEDEANARLIIAAPEMLEALKKEYELLDAIGRTVGMDIVLGQRWLPTILERKKAIKATLAKANPGADNE